MAYETMKQAMAGKGRAQRVALILLLVPAMLLVSSCRDYMHNMLSQPKFIPLRENKFYADLRSARTPVEGTIARGQLEDDSLLYTGKVNGKEVDLFPFAITAQDLARGRQRFNIYCSPCHSEVGDGNGMIAQRGFKNPPSYYEPRLLKAPVGHFVNVMTNGWGAMSEYSAQVPVADRWRIAAYIRALQLSRTAKMSDVPPGEQVASQEPKQLMGSYTEAEKAIMAEDAAKAMNKAANENRAEPTAEPNVTEPKVTEPKVTEPNVTEPREAK